MNTRRHLTDKQRHLAIAPFGSVAGSQMLLLNLVCLKVSSADLHEDIELLAEFVTDPGVEPHE